VAQDEVASLSRSLNAMLAQIEQSFAVREASEERMSQFVADASHELRTPLAAVRGYAELFRQGAVSKPEDVAGAMRRIEDESIRMGGLVEDLLLLTRMDRRPPL
jgi:two-component system OmpR family sensor kinase